MFIYSFEKLEVWQLSRRICSIVYRLTSKFPPEERYGLQGQMRRASLSVASNLAEGSGRITSRNRSNFYSIAYSSALELINQIIIARDLEFLDADEYQTCRSLLEELTNKINALSKSMR